MRPEVSDRLRVRVWMRRIEDLTRGTKDLAPVGAFGVSSGHVAQLFTWSGLRAQSPAQPSQVHTQPPSHGNAMVPRLSDLQAQLRKGVGRWAVGVVRRRRGGQGPDAGEGCPVGRPRHGIKELG